LRQDSRQVLLDATDNLDYLNLIVLSNEPARFILNVDADPLRVAIYAPLRGYYLKTHDAAVVDTYFTDKFAMKSGLDLSLIRARQIGYVLVHNEVFIQAIDKNPYLVRLGTFGPWVLYGPAKSDPSP